MRNMPRHAVAHGLRLGGQGTESVRQHGINFCTNALAQNRGRALRANRNHHRVAVHNRWNNKSRDISLVNSVDLNAARLCISTDCCVQCSFRRIDQLCTIQQRSIIGLGQPVHAWIGSKLIMQFRSNHIDFRIRFQKQPDFAQGFFTAAHYNHAGVFQVYKDRKIAHCLVLHSKRALPAFATSSTISS